MTTKLSPIAPYALLPFLLACDASSRSPTTADAAAGSTADGSTADAGPPYSPTELRVSVIGINDLGEGALEGAVVAIEQDGAIRMFETDAQGYATLPVEADGGPITLSASLKGYMPVTYVGYVRARDFALGEPNGAFSFKLRAFKTDLIEVLVNVQRQSPDASMLMATSTVATFYSGQGDGLYVKTVKDRPFTITAIEHITELALDAQYGMKTPVLSWRTRDAQASQRDLTLNLTTAKPVDLSDRLLRVVRPKPGSILANDTALPFVGLQRVVSRAPVEIFPAAAVSAIAPWYQTEEFEITLTGPKDQLASEELTLTVTIADPQGRSSAVTVEGALPERVDLPFLEPPQLATVTPDIGGTITWQEPDDPAAWPVFSLVEGLNSVNTWSIVGFPGVTSFDLAALRGTVVSVLSDSDLGSLGGNLALCDTESVGSYCTRLAKSARFELGAKDEQGL